MYSSWYWQHYIVNVQLDKEHVSEGLETAGLPEGILSMPEFLLEYCSASVSHETACNVKFVFYIVHCLEKKPSQ